MRTKANRGLWRLTIVLIIPWAIAWSLLYWNNRNHAKMANEEALAWEVCGSRDLPPDKISESFQNCPLHKLYWKFETEHDLITGQVPPTWEAFAETARIRSANKAGRAEHWQNVDALIGFGAPVGLALIAYAGIWVWNGFWPQAKQPPM